MFRTGRDVHDEDVVRDTPGSVVGAVAAATASLPFLAVYAILFIVHGGVHPVAPPDITDTAHGELVAGFIALAWFVVAVTALLWLLNGRRRWPFVLVQAALLGTAVDFLIDPTKGGRGTSFIVALASLIALVLAFAPDTWEYVGRPRPKRRKRPAMPVGAGAGPDTTPDAARYVGRRETSKDPQSV
jgi:hypothetical protein